MVFPDDGLLHDAIIAPGGVSYAGAGVVLRQYDVELASMRHVELSIAYQDIGQAWRAIRVTLSKR